MNTVLIHGVRTTLIPTQQHCRKAKIASTVKRAFTKNNLSGPNNHMDSLDIFLANIIGGFARFSLRPEDIVESLLLGSDKIITSVGIQTWRDIRKTFYQAGEGNGVKSLTPQQFERNYVSWDLIDTILTRTELSQMQIANCTQQTRPKSMLNLMRDLLAIRRSLQN